MDVARSALVGLFLLVSCNALTGADELGVEDATSPLPERSFGPEAVDAGDAPSFEAASPIDASAEASPPLVLLRAITFEDGALVHPATGFDGIFGAPKATMFALRGVHAMTIDGQRAGGILSFAPTTDLTTTFRILVLPKSSKFALVVARVRLADGRRIDLTIESITRVLRISQGAYVYGTGGVLPTDARAHRIALRVGPYVELRVAENDDPFGAPLITAKLASPVPATSFEIGGLDDDGFIAIVDDVIVERSP